MISNVELLAGLRDYQNSLTRQKMNEDFPGLGDHLWRKFMANNSSFPLHQLDISLLGQLAENVEKYVNEHR